MNQLQMLTLFGSCGVGDRMWTPDNREFRKETHNVGREVNSNEPYYFDPTDRVYVNVGKSKEIAQRYFVLSQPQKGSLIHVRA
jgi:hypothetical protein